MAQPLNKFPIFYGTLRFTRAHHWQTNPAYIRTLYFLKIRSKEHYPPYLTVLYLTDGWGVRSSLCLLQLSIHLYAVRRTPTLVRRWPHGLYPLVSTRSTWCVQVLRSPKEAFAAAMQSWRERCEKSVCLQGDYVEKWLHFQLPVVSIF